MTKTIVIFGTLVFVALMYAIPVLITCAIMLHWNGFVTLLLCVCGFVQFVGTASMAYARAEGDLNE